VSPTKRILVVQYLFPPLGGAGVQRVLKFVKYLVPLGWEVKVLTTMSQGYLVHDDSLAAEVPPEVEIFRARELPVVSLRDALMNPLHRLRVPGLLQYIGWPDERSGWLPFAAREGLRVVDKFLPDVIFSSSSPFSAHLVARVISGARGIPWVADFRDPWTEAGTEDAPRVLAALNRRTERNVVKHAQRVTVADDPVHVAGMQADDDRRVVIYNGVDEADFVNEPETTTDIGGSFSLTHVGTLYGFRDAAPVFGAIARLVQSGRLDQSSIDVRLVGNVWLGEHGLSSLPYQVTAVGYVPHHEAIREMLSASALFFYQPDDYPVSSGKIFEYLVAGRPILCVAQRSNLASRLVEEFDAGIVAEPSDAAAIDQAIATLYSRWKAGSFAVAPAVRERVLARFSRRSLTRQLDAVLTDVAIETGHHFHRRTRRR